MTSSHERLRAYERSAFQWSIADIPKTITVDGERMRNPALHNGIFVVHGMGTQTWVETSATLRLGLEDALDVLFEQTRGRFLNVERKSLTTPPIEEGYWADYDNFKDTFPEVWNSLESRSRSYYEKLWMTSPVSSVAGLLTLLTVAPLREGSVETTLRSTDAGSSRPIGRPS